MILPDDTLFERKPIAGFSPEDVRLMKTIMLTTCRQLQGEMTAAELVDAIEGLRRRGFVEIVADGDDVTVRPTPTGAAAGWILAATGGHR